MLYCDECGTISDKNYGPEDGNVRCPRCAGATEEAPATSGLSLLDEPGSLQKSGFEQSKEEMNDLDLFSSETIAQKRNPKESSDETRLTLVEENPVDSVELSDSFHTRNAPLPPVPEQWRFECLACSGSLRLDPVTQRCKVRCPRCQTWMVLGPEGTLNLPNTGKKNEAPVNQDTVASDVGDEYFTCDSPKTITPPSAASLRAVDSQENACSDTITMAPPCESAEPITVPQIDEDLLGMIGEDPNQFGQEFDLETESDPQPECNAGSSSQLTDATVVLWVGLFVLPSLMALLISRLAPASEVHQVLSRIGVTFQHNCGEFLTFLSGLMTSL